MALPRAKKRSATVFSRDEIGVEQLQSLKEKFADGDLNEKEFVSLFREIVDASLSETQLTELFQKIDANSDGTVDWDELTNYMFLSGSGSDEYTGDDGNSCYDTAYPEKYAGDSGNGSGGTGSSIATDIMGNVTGGSGGFLSLGLLPHHKDVITRIVRLERPSVYLTTSKDGSVRTWSANTLAPQQVLASGRDWLTDCCVMKRSNRLACIPLCLAYVERPSDDREAIVIGDDTGGISIFTCSNQWLSCDGRSPPPGATTAANSTNGASNGSGVSQGTVNSGPTPPSGSTTGNSAGNTQTATPTSNSSSVGGNPAGSAMLEAQGFSSRVKFQKHTDWITRVKWVNDMRAVVATSLDATVSILDVDRLVVKFEYTRASQGNISSSTRKAKLRGGTPVERPVRLACYNSVFHQVVTAAMDAESAIKTWSAETGEEISSFARPHDSNPVTSIAFDHAGRRLLTGSHDGEQLKMWNFSNGALVKQFHKKEPQVVSSLLFTTTPATAGTVASTAPLPDDPSGSSDEAAAMTNAPRKRKPRDIMLLPASFGMDHEGRRGNSALMAQTELPSPTRVRLQQGQEHPTPVPPLNSTPRAQPGDTASSPRPPRTTREPETSRYRQHEVTSIMDIERNLRVGMGDFICQRFVCCVGWDRQLFVWADKNDESESLPVHILPPDSDDDDSEELEYARRGRRRRRRQHHTMDVLALAW
ncbi:uncharacterized protein PITG_21164 [Phytophthora infestans T30-4]|uniref:EF-hand domain-containing protein n=1 Tax=Phytophthora infestans (strain T30-4) TaxID=403677 RepID=D0P3Q3_PHYIT|nr:uncharacterized protein PITG_21164 [Phytophthora infestans T30-4]EEY60495.1 conserved hypothetical protein [Phytophthora infestans T30-4]|eukprot:XP_002895072.1 conserved hypothetical protein [Phytophthora infestans T30-4]